MEYIGTKLPRDLTFKCMLICSLIGVGLYFIAFVTPYWIELKPEMQSTFVRLGLWVTCFNGYMHPEDYVSKAYYGCWYVYYPEYYYIRSWLNPAWFYAIQILAIVALLCLIIAAAVISRIACHRYSAKRRIEELPGNLKQLKFACILHLIASSAILIQIIYIGLESLDRKWMPRPDYNRLGFSYACAVFANFASFFAFAFTLIRFVGKSEEELLFAEQHPAVDAAEVNKLSTAATSGFGTADNKKGSMSRLAAPPPDDSIV